MALGIFLRSIDSPRTNFTFEDTLTQIGLGYTFAFLISFFRRAGNGPPSASSSFGYWLAWAMYPAPGPAFNYAAVGVPADWHYNFTGFASHWNKNSNLGQAFDLWFLNLFPRERPFAYNGGGYLTLELHTHARNHASGVVRGSVAPRRTTKDSNKKFLLAAALLISAALLLHFSGVCPIVKRIWTPAWTLFSGGVCFLFLSAFSWLIDMRAIVAGLFRWWWLALIRLRLICLRTCVKTSSSAVFTFISGTSCSRFSALGWSPCCSASLSCLPTGWFFSGCAEGRSTSKSNFYFGSDIWFNRLWNELDI